MANENLYAGVADAMTAETLSGDFGMLTASRESLPQHPALVKAGDTGHRGSATIKVPLVNLGGGQILTSTADGAEVANSALSMIDVTVTPTRHSKSIEVSDLAKSLDATGMLRADVFAVDAVAASANTLVSLIANVGDDFVPTVGSTGSNLSISDFSAAINKLEVAGVEGPYLAILSPQQWGHLRDALIAASGAIAFAPATMEQIAMLGTGYKGKVLGVDVFVSAHVPTKSAGAGWGGCMFGKWGIAWADMSIDVENGPEALNIGGKVLFERDRTAKAGLTAYVTHAYLGASIGDPNAGVSIITRKV